MVNFSKIKTIHFIGIGGIGVSALAKMMITSGKKASGSDLGCSALTEDLKKLGVVVYEGHRGENLPADADLVVYSSAAPKDNPERKEAAKRKIPQLSYFEALGMLSEKKFTIAVSGTHGKTTTTALVGLILEKAGFDPTVIVGGKVKKFGGNFRQGKGKYFVVEACEHQAHMLELNPKVIILTNIEEDHLDYYRDLDHIKKTFQKYIDKLPVNGILVLNADDPVSQKLKKPNCRVITFGIKNQADIMAKNIKSKNSHQYFDIVYKNNNHSPLSTIRSSLIVPGIFNVYNALAATAVALALKVPVSASQKVLAGFPGTWRRFEKVGEKNGAVIISDYAHHPTAVRETIRAAKEFYPKKRIVVVFQPHQHSRTRKLFKDFVKSFFEADIIILSEIFDVAGREEKADWKVSSRDLAREIKKEKKNVFYGKDLEETKKLLLKNIRPNDLVLIMGAGDIYRTAEEIVCE